MLQRSDCLNPGIYTKNNISSSGFDKEEAGHGTVVFEFVTKVPCSCNMAFCKPDLLPERRNVVTKTIFRLTLKASVILILLLLCGMLRAQENRQHHYGVLYTDCNVDTLATYPGGENDLYRFFEQRVIPTHLMTGGSENSVFNVIMKLYFSDLGLLDSVEYKNSSNAYLEKSINKALQSMPPWNPAKKDGIAVSSYVYLPLTFSDAGGYFVVRNSGLDVAVTKNKGFTMLKGVLLIGAVVLFSALFFSW